MQLWGSYRTSFKRKNHSDCLRPLAIIIMPKSKKTIMPKSKKPLDTTLQNSLRLAGHEFLCLSCWMEAGIIPYLSPKLVWEASNILIFTIMYGWHWGFLDSRKKYYTSSSADSFLHDHCYWYFYCYLVWMYRRCCVLTLNWGTMGRVCVAFAWIACVRRDPLRRCLRTQFVQLWLILRSS